MKTIITVFALVSLILIGCTEESTKDTTIKDEQACQFVDPVNDLVAFLDPVQEKLFVLPDQKDIVIKTLGAELLDDDMYTMNAVTVGKRNIQMSFTISVINSPSQIYFYVDDLNRRIIDWMANQDTTRGDYIHTFKDRAGTYYRVYKNAECKKVRDSKETNCLKEFVLDSSYSKPETGRYEKTEFDELNNCLKGDKYCVEALVITMRRIIYNDKNCTQALEIYPYYNYNCIK